MTLDNKSTAVVLLSLRYSFIKRKVHWAGSRIAATTYISWMGNRWSRQFFIYCFRWTMTGKSASLTSRACSIHARKITSWLILGYFAPLRTSVVVLKTPTNSVMHHLPLLSLHTVHSLSNILMHITKAPLNQLLFSYHAIQHYQHSIPTRRTPRIEFWNRINPANSASEVRVTDIGTRKFKSLYFLSIRPSSGHMSLLHAKPMTFQWWGLNFLPEK